MNITVNMPELAMGLVFICSPRSVSSQVHIIILRILFIILSTVFNLNTYFSVSDTVLKFIVGAQISSCRDLLA